MTEVGQSRDAARRPRAAHLGPEKRRPLVLDAALPLFLERGYAGTSMEAIAEAARVAKPVVYECYPDKRRLFHALLEREEQRLFDALLAALPSDPDLADTEAMIVDGFTALFTAVAVAPDAWRLVWRSDPQGDRAVGERVAGARRLVRERAAAVAAALLAERGVPDPDQRRARVVGELMLGLGEAGVRLLLEDPAQWSPDELGAYIGGLVARGERGL